MEGNQHDDVLWVISFVGNIGVHPSLELSHYCSGLGTYVKEMNDVGQFNSNREGIEILEREDRQDAC